MNLENKLMRFLIIICLILVFSVQYIAPIAGEKAYAAETSGKPEATVTQITLYTGYKNYTTKYNNLLKDAKISYSSSNNSVASVSKAGIIKPLKAGNATITATIKQGGKTYTSKIKVTVEVPKIEITKMVYKIEVGSSYAFTGIEHGVSGAVLSWSSSDTSVGTIDNTSGLFKAKAAGSTTITVEDKKTGNRAVLTITVTPAYTAPEGSDKAVYQSGLDLSKLTGISYTTTKEEYIETSRFILYLDEGVEVPLNIFDSINHIMDRIEEETGYQFYVPHYDNTEYRGMTNELDKYFSSAEEFKKIGKDHEKVEIVVTQHDQAVDAYANGRNGILILPKHLKLQDDSQGYAMVHELSHIAFARNGRYMGGVLEEGFAEYFTDLILEHDDVLQCTYDAYENLKGYENIITEQNAENMFLNYTAGSSRYQFGFRLTCYIMEKYGIKAYQRVHAKVTESYTGLGDDTPMEIIDQALKSELSENFFPEFAKWLADNRDRFGDKDMSTVGDWDIMYGTLNKYYGDDKNVVIPDEVNYINSEAFMENKYVETVKIPDLVTVIAGGAFFNCKNLKEIKIPDSVTMISFNAFEGCTNLKKVVLQRI